MLMATKVPLPVGHPPMSRFVCANSSALEFLQGACPISVSNSHPPLDAAINGSEPFPANHLKMQATFAPYMPLNHRWGCLHCMIASLHMLLPFFLRRFIALIVLILPDGFLCLSLGTLTC